MTSCRDRSRCDLTDQTNSVPGSRASGGRGADVSKTRLGKKGSTTTERAANARKQVTAPSPGAIQPKSIGPVMVPTDRKKKTTPDPIDGRSLKSRIPHTMKPVPGAIDV